VAIAENNEIMTKLLDTDAFGNIKYALTDTDATTLRNCLYFIDYAISAVKKGHIRLSTWVDLDFYQIFDQLDLIDQLETA
jgi:hypothetical protein